MDENDPENAITMLSYLNREQYGDFPLTYGNYYNAPTKSQQYFGDKDPIYAKDEAAKKYVVVDDRKKSVPVYEEEYCTVFLVCGVNKVTMKRLTAIGVMYKAITKPNKK
jgi:hypothetical protein